MSTRAIPLDSKTINLLRVLGDPVQVIQALAEHAASGIRRPGAWERAWVEQLFGFEWHERLEADPNLLFCVRPRGKVLL